MRFLFNRRKPTMVTPNEAVAGRDLPAAVPERHAVLGTPLRPPFPNRLSTAVFGLGCFWGAERMFWRTSGVYTTAVGYSGGFTPNPTYEEVCGGRTGHTEAVLVVFDPAKVSYRDLLAAFWEGHDPTQEMRQGNDVGTQYRSAIYYLDDEQRRATVTAAWAGPAWPVRSGSAWRRRLNPRPTTRYFRYPAAARSGESGSRRSSTPSCARRGPSARSPASTWTPTARNGRSDTCWIVNTDDGKFAFVTNAMSGDISSYRVEPDGTLVLLESVAATLRPIAADMALSGDSRYHVRAERLGRHDQRLPRRERRGADEAAGYRGAPSRWRRNRHRRQVRAVSFTNRVRGRLHERRSPVRSRRVQ